MDMIFWIKMEVIWIRFGSHWGFNNSQLANEKGDKKHVKKVSWHFDTVGAAYGADDYKAREKGRQEY